MAIAMKTAAMMNLPESLVCHATGLHNLRDIQMVLSAMQENGYQLSEMSHAEFVAAARAICSDQSGVMML